MNRSRHFLASRLSTVDVPVLYKKYGLVLAVRLAYMGAAETETHDQKHAVPPPIQKIYNLSRSKGHILLIRAGRYHHHDGAYPHRGQSHRYAPFPYQSSITFRGRALDEQVREATDVCVRAFRGGKPRLSSPTTLSLTRTSYRSRIGNDDRIRPVPRTFALREHAACRARGRGHAALRVSAGLGADLRRGPVVRSREEDVCDVSVVSSEVRMWQLNRGGVERSRGSRGSTGSWLLSRRPCGDGG